MCVCICVCVCVCVCTFVYVCFRVVASVESHTAVPRMRMLSHVNAASLWQNPATAARAPPSLPVSTPAARKRWAIGILHCNHFSGYFKAYCVKLQSLVPSCLQLQYNFIAKCRYTDCTRNVLWCQLHSSYIHSNHKTFNYNKRQINILVKSHS